MKLNLLLLTLLVASVAAHVGINDNPARRNIEVLPEMVRTASYKSYSANPDFADGKTLQLPPEGTVARGARPIHYAATPEDAARAGRELQAPPPSPGTLERGAHVFQTVCQSCHGGAGKGDGPVALRGFPPPPPLTAQHAVGLADGQMYHIITYGQKNMPSHAAQVAPEDRWRVIAYIRTLQRPAGEAAK